MREHTFEPAGEPRLRANVPAGAVELETHDGTEMTVRLAPVRDDEETREAIEHATVELHGNELVIQIREQRFRLGRTPEVRVEVGCPEGTHARVDTASCHVRARGTLGDVEAHVASGDVELERVDGRLKAHSASGDIRVSSVRGDVDVHSASGELELGYSDGPVKVHSASGDVSLGDAGAGPIRVRSVSGDVRIGVRAGRRVAVDVRTVSGDAHSDILLDEGAGEGGDGPLVEIQVNGVSGDVQIGRAADAPALGA
jgi:Toastrack DUF4097